MTDEQQPTADPWWVKLIQPLGLAGLMAALLYVVLVDQQVERSEMRTTFIAVIEKLIDPEKPQPTE